MPQIPGTYDPSIPEKKEDTFPFPRSITEVPVVDTPERDLATQGTGSPLEEVEADALSAAFQKLGNVKKTTLDRSMFLAGEKNPDKYAQVLDLSEKTGIPSQAVEQEFDAVKKFNDSKSNNTDKILKETPITADWMTDLDNATISLDDYEALKKIEKTQEWAKGLEQVIALGKTTAFRIAKQVAGLPAYLQSTAAMMDKATTSQREQDLGLMPGELAPMGTLPLASKDLVDNKAVRYWRERAAEEAKKAPLLTEDVIDAISDGIKNKNLEHAAAVVAANVATNLPQTIMMFYAGIPGLLTTGAMSGADALGEAVDAGLSPEMATVNANLHAVTETAFETVGTYGIFKSWEGAISKSFGKGVSQEFFTNLFKTFGYAFAGEFSEEFSTSVAQDYADFLTGKNPDALKGIGKRALGAGVIGGFSGLSTTAPLATAAGIANAEAPTDSGEIQAPKIEDADQAELSEANHAERVAILNKDNYNRMGDDYAGTKVHERSNPRQAALADAVYKQAGKENILVDAKDLDLLFQEDEVGKGQFLNQMGIAEKYEASLESGQPIVIRTSEWMSKLAPTREHKKFADIVRFKEDQRSVNSAKENSKLIKEKIEQKKQVKIARKESAKKAAKEAVAQLKETNTYGADMPDNIEELLTRFFETRGEVTKKDPYELYQNEGVPLNIIQFGDTPQGMDEALQQAEFKHPATQVNPLGYYSALARAVDSTSEKAFQGSPKDLLQKISKTQGVKKEEIEVTGLNEFLNSLAEQGQKATKEQILDFLQNNGVRIQQVVLSDDYEDGTGAVGDLNWSDPVRDDSYDSSNIENEMESYLSSDNEDDILETINTWKENNEDEERSAEELFALGKSPTNSWSWDVSKLPRELSRYLENHYSERATEYVESDDYHGATYTVTEETTGYTLTGSDDMGWYSSEFNKDFGNNLNEAKIQLAAKLIEKGLIEGNEAELSREEDFSWRHLQGHNVTYNTKEIKAKALFKSDPEKYKALALEKLKEYNSLFEDYKEGTPFTKEQEEKIKDKALDIAEDDINAQYEDPNNKRNILTIAIDHPMISGSISGNNIKGWTLNVQGPSAKSQNKSEKWGIVDTYVTPFLKKGFSHVAEGGYLSTALVSAVVEEVDPKEAYEAYLESIDKKPAITKKDFLNLVKDKTFQEMLEEYDRVSKDVVGDKTPLAAKDMEMAKEEAKALLISEGFMKPSGTKAPASAEDINKPTGPAKWGQYVVGEGRNNKGENYRVFLLRLPGNKGGGFSESTHFSNIKDVVVFMRVTDREGVNGEKVLVIEELQSDWQEHAFKFGVKDKKALDESEAEVDRLSAERDFAREQVNAAQTKLQEYILDQYDLEEKGIGTEYQAIRSALLKSSDDSIQTSAEAIEKVKDDINGKKYADEYLNAIDKKADIDEAYKKANIAKEGLEQAVSPAPFQENKAYSALGMKRMMTLAIQEGYDAVAVTPSVVHLERWGTDSMMWVKKEQKGFGIRAKRRSQYIEDKFIKDTTAREFSTREEAQKFLELRVKTGTNNKDWQKEEIANLEVTEPGTYYLVGAREQVGGNVDEGNIEEMARARGVLLETEGQKVSTKEDLAKIVKNFLSRDRGPKQQEDFVTRVWDRMQKQETGVKEPRKEGMQKAYDEILPSSAMANVARVLDPASKVEDLAIKTEHGLDPERLKKQYNVDVSSIAKPDQITMKAIRITDKMKTSILAGLPMFQAEGRVVRGFFSKVHNLIGLTKHKNLSTFFHEFGHYMFSSIQDDYNYVKALDIKDKDQERFLKDVDAILAHLKADSVNELTREQQEEFARLFEAYLYTGKAPTKNLKDAFYSFKFILRKIYESIKSLRVDLTPELENIFARIVAGSDAIERSMQVHPQPMDPKALHMSESQLEEYNETMRAMRQEAEEELTSRLLTDLKKQQEKEYKDLEANIRKEVEDVIAQDPIYKAIDILKSGELPGGEQVLDGKLKLSRQEVTVKYGKEFTDKLPRAILSNKGQSLDYVSELLGFESSTEMMTGISEKTPKEIAIEEYVNRIMQERYPDSFVEPLLTENAKQALYNNSSAKLKKIEADILYKEHRRLNKDLTKRVGSKPPRSDAELKEQATEVISKMAVKDVRPYKFELAERKYSREAIAHAAAGRIDEAFEAKNKERLNHELYKQALALEKLEEKKLKKLKNIQGSNEELSKKYDMNSLNTARAVMALYGIGKSDKLPMEYFSEMAKYDKEAYTTNLPYVEEASIGAAPYKEVTVQKFLEMIEVTESLINYARAQKQIEIAGQKMNKEIVVGNLVAQITKILQPKEKAKYKKTVGEDEAARADFLDLAARLVRVSHFTNAADAGGSKVFTETFRDPIQEKSDLVMRDTRRFIKKFEEAVVKHKNIFKNEEIEAPELVDSKGRVFVFRNSSELLMAILHTGNHSNLQKLIRGREWGEVDPFNKELNTTRWDSFLQRMIKEGKITKAHYDFAQEIWDIMEEMKPMTQEAHKKRFGRYFSEITSNPISTPWGVYRGGYMPAKVAIYENLDAATREARELFEQNNMSWAFPTAGSGPTKSRIEAYSAPLSLDMSLVGTHINWAMKFAHLENVTKDLAVLLSDKTLVGNLEELHPGIVKHALLPWLNRTAKQIVVTPGESKFVDNFLKRVTKGFSMNVLTLNIPNYLQQYTGIVVAKTLIDGKHLRSAMADYVSNRKKMFDDMIKESIGMENLQANTVYEMNQNIEKIMLNPSQKELTAEMLRDTARAVNSFTQNQTNTIVYWAAKNDFIAKNHGSNNAAAIRHAVDIVKRTQGSPFPQDISAFEVGTPAQKLLKMFYTYFNGILNLNVFGYQKAERETGKWAAKKRLAFLAFWSIYLPSVLFEALRKGVFEGDLDEDDDERYIDDILGVLIGAPMRTALATIPVAGQAVSAVINRFNDKVYDDRASFSPIASAVDSVGSFAYEVYKGFDPKKDARESRMFKDASMALGTWLGIPLAPIGKPVGYVLDVSQNKIKKPTGPADAVRGVVTGKGERVKQ